MLICVIRAYARNADLYLAGLEASRLLDGKLPTTLLLFHDSDYDPTPILPVAQEAFESVVVIPQDPAPQGAWPLPQNVIWQQSARWINDHQVEFAKRTGWLWWEADCCPLRKGWLATLSEAHRKGRTLFSGVRCQMHQESYMNGVGIYPVDTLTPLSTSAALYCRNNPFDFVAGPSVMGSFTDLSHLMLHHRKQAGGHVGMVFNERTLSDLLMLKPKAVWYHGCGDGSLQLLMAGKPPPPPLFASSNKVAPTLLQVLTAWREGVDVTQLTDQSKVTRHRPRYIHVVERHRQRNPNDEPRILRAVDSWITLYANPRVTPCHVWHYPRSSASLGDPRALPYLKDVLIEGMTRAAHDEDVIMWTNDDTILHPTVIDALDEMLSKVDACGSMRLNFHPGTIPPLTCPPEVFVAQGERDLGRDLFAFRKHWLREHWHAIPDFFLGELEFDLNLTVLIRKSAKILTDRRNLPQPCPDCEIPNGYVIHEIHHRAWVSKEFVDSPSKLYNQKLAIQFYHRMGLEPPTF